MNELLPIEWAAGIAKRMKNCFGYKFDKQWEGQSRDELLEAIQDILSGLTADELARGCETMKSKTFCPSLSEFRSWCRPVAEINSKWISGSTAWSVAIASQDEANTIIWTAENQEAWESVRSLIEIKDKFHASKAFIEKYDALVEIAKAENRMPVYVTSMGTDPDKRVQAIEKAERENMLKLSGTERMGMIGYIQEERKPLSQTALDAIANLKSQLGMDQKTMTEKRADELAKIEDQKQWQTEVLKERIETRHIDPFNDAAEYKELVQSDIGSAFRATNLRYAK